MAKSEVRTKRARAAAVALLMSLFASAAFGQVPTLSPTVPLPKVSIWIDDKPLMLRPDQTVSTEVFVWVDSAEKAPLSNVTFFLNMKRGPYFPPCRATVTNVFPTSVLALGKSTAVPIEIKGCSGGQPQGALGILNSADPSEVDITLVRARSAWLTFAVYFSLSLSLLVGAYGAVEVTRHGHKLSDTIGGTFWDFSSSWATNITAFGAAFALVLSLMIFPDKPILGARNEYSFLVLFAGALVGLAPAVQRMLSKTNVDQSSGSPVLVTQGVVKGFLLSSAFTMWGAYLQVAVAVLTVAELAATGTLTWVIAIPIGTCILLVGVGLAFYCWWKIVVVIAKNASKTGTATVKPENANPMFAVPSPTPAAAAAGKIPLL